MDRRRANVGGPLRSDLWSKRQTIRQIQRRSMRLAAAVGPFPIACASPRIRASVAIEVTAQSPQLHAIGFALTCGREREGRLFAAHSDRRA